MYKMFWRIRAKLDRVIYDERSASNVRMWFVISLSFAFIFLGYYLFENVDTAIWAEMWRNKFPYFSWIPISILRLYNFIVYGFRHMIIPIAVFIFMLFASSAYVQDVYELPSLRLGLEYIQAAFFGIGYPRLEISEGKKQISKGEVNLIDTIGGPGYVNIRPGNVVLFESLRSPSSVRANTTNFISRFVTIKEIVSLEDQHGFIEKIVANTKDGIEVVVSDIHYRYRLRTGRRFGDFERRKAVDPYPYSIQAVKDMAYNRTVGSDGLAKWHATVGSSFNGGIVEYIKSHKFDDITAPQDDERDPRKEIATNIGKEIRLRLRSVGAELLWFDMGHFGISDRMKATIADQRVDTWGTQLDSSEILVGSSENVRRQAYQIMGRGEGQAALLLGILQALDEVRFDTSNGESRKQHERLENLREILWKQVGQLYYDLDKDREEDNT